MIKYLRRKTTEYTTKAEAETKKAELTSLKEFSLISKSEDNKIMTEKEIKLDSDFVEDKDVDTTEIHLCDHDEKGRSTEGGCKIVSVAK